MEKVNPDELLIKIESWKIYPKITQDVFDLLLNSVIQSFLLHQIHLEIFEEHRTNLLELDKKLPNNDKLTNMTSDLYYVKTQSETFRYLKSDRIKAYKEGKIEQLFPFTSPATVEDVFKMIKDGKAFPEIFPKAVSMICHLLIRLNPQFSHLFEIIEYNGSEFLDMNDRIIRTLESTTPKLDSIENSLKKITLVGIAGSCVGGKSSFLRDQFGFDTKFGHTEEVEVYVYKERERTFFLDWLEGSLANLSQPPNSCNERGFPDSASARVPKEIIAIIGVCHIVCGLVNKRDGLTHSFLNDVVINSLYHNIPHIVCLNRYEGYYLENLRHSPNPKEPLLEEFKIIKEEFGTVAEFVMCELKEGEMDQRVELDQPLWRGSDLKKWIKEKL